MFFNDPNRRGDPYGLWQLIQEQEKKRQQELLQQQQYLQGPFGQPAQPQDFEHGPVSTGGFGVPSPGSRIPTNVRDLPASIADLPDMSEAQVRALDKDVYNELFGSANASLVPAWIKIEKMEQRKREAANQRRQRKAHPRHSFANADSEESEDDFDLRTRFESLDDDELVKLANRAYDAGARGLPDDFFWDWFDSTYVRETFPQAYLEMFQRSYEEGWEYFLENYTIPI